MTVYEKILALLTESSTPFEELQHAPVRTSLEAAKIRDTGLTDGAKALVLFADKQPILAVLPGNLRIDFKAFKKEFGVKDLRMATPDEVFSLTTLEIGSIPPIGKVLGLTSYYSELFKEKSEVVFNAGSLTNSVRMAAKDLIKLELPKFGTFTQES